MASREDRAALSAYAQARAAGSFGEADQAAQSYATALSFRPDNEVLAYQAFVQALEAGNQVLARNAAKVVEAAGASNADVRLFLMSEALRSGKWKAARAHIDAIEKDEVFGFMAPVLRAWIAADTGKGDPFALLNAGPTNPVTASYAAEHRPLLLLATDRMEMGLAELKALTPSATMRNQRLRIATAAMLQEKGDRQAALELLEGGDPALVTARRLIENGQNIPGAIDTASAGIAELLVRLAGDLHRQDLTSLGLRFARLATFLAPENSETWLVTGDLLTSEGLHDAALIALSHVDAADPFRESAGTARIRLLVATDQQQAAISEAEAAVKGNASAADWTRLGDLYLELDRPLEAANAYEGALALGGPGAGEQLWALHLLRGGALDEAGRWPEAKAELEAAYKLAPDQAIVLNYLGYAQLERRENIEEAMRLIAEASRLQPDSPEITDSLGWAHFLQGDIDKAVELLERAVMGQPADSEINEHLGDAYYKAGRRYEARYAWKAALVYAEDESAERLRAKIDAGLTPQLASP